MKKYLVLGPGGMGYFSLLGALKCLGDDKIDAIEEFSGSSAGSILAMLLGLGWSLDKIMDMSFSTNIHENLKYSIKGIISGYGLIDHECIKTELIDMVGSNPTFKDLTKNVHISSYCVNRSTTVYFSRETHPDMAIIDAVCMSISVPFLFSAYKYNDHLYVDGGLMENIPYTPFVHIPRDEVFSIIVNYNNGVNTEITDIKQYVQILVRSILTNRIEYDTNNISIDIENIDIFDFSMSEEDKIRLYTTGFEAGRSKFLDW